MNKNLLIVVTFLGLLILTACGSESGTNGTNESQSETQETSVETSTEETKDEKLGLGSTFEFDGSSGLIEIHFGTDITWKTIDNEYSDNNGATIFGIPMTVTNKSDETGGLNPFDFTVFGSKGTTLDSVGSEFDDNITWMGDLRPGASQSGVLYILYDGDGEYAIEFGTFSGSKQEVVFNITK